MKEILVSKDQIGKAVVNNGLIYINWNSNFELMEPDSMSKISVSDHKKPLFLLQGNKKYKRVRMMFSTQALDVLMEANKDNISELKSQISAPDADNKVIQTKLERLKKSFELYERLEDMKKNTKIG